jgi:hypothetical protein
MLWLKEERKASINDYELRITNAIATVTQLNAIN